MMKTVNGGWYTRNIPAGLSDTNTITQEKPWLGGQGQMLMVMAAVEKNGKEPVDLQELWSFNMYYDHSTDYDHSSWFTCLNMFKLYLFWIDGWLFLIW